MVRQSPPSAVPPLSGVFPVLATPFLPDGAPDEAGLAAIVRYVVAAGADGVVFPGVASEFESLTLPERSRLAAVVAETVAGAVPMVLGGSVVDPAQSDAVVGEAAALGAAAVMILAPKSLATFAALRDFYARAADIAGVPVMLQNAPAPVGAGLPVSLVLEVAAAVPRIAYIKEEALPSGARISALVKGAPSTLLGVLGGAGGRYLPDELARGAIGTMPACELTELHAALFRAHRAGDRAAVRAHFNRMLPLLNFQAVFRMAMTKEVLRRRGIIDYADKRAAGPALDAGDHAELGELLAEVADLLAPPLRAIH